LHNFGQPKREPRWGTFLDSLVRSGLCTAGQREALLKYPGYVDEKAMDVTWPAALRQASRLLGGRSLSTFVRSLHHVKIVYRQGEPLEAKATWRATTTGIRQQCDPLRSGCRKATLRLIAGYALPPYVVA
jgi:hypothetical protein